MRKVLNNMEARGGCAAVEYKGKVFISGGASLNEIFGDIWMYATLKYTKIPTFIAPRFGHTMVAINNKAFIYGGQNPAKLEHYSDLLAFNLGTHPNRHQRN